MTQVIHQDRVKIEQSSPKRIESNPHLKCPTCNCQSSEKNESISRLSESEWEQKSLEIIQRFETEFEEFFITQNMDLSKFSIYKKLKAEYDLKQSEIWKEDEKNKENIFSPYRDKALADLRIRYMKKLEKALGAEDYAAASQFIEIFNKQQFENHEKEPTTPVILISF